MIDFLFVIIELFCYLLQLRRYKRKSVEVGVFRRGWVNLSANFRRKGASSTNHCWCQKTRVPVLSAVCVCVPFVWYQYILGALFGFVTKHTCDGQTDGQNYDSQDCTSIAALRGIKLEGTPPTILVDKNTKKMGIGKVYSKCSGIVEEPLV